MGRSTFKTSIIILGLLITAATAQLDDSTASLADPVAQPIETAAQPVEPPTPPAAQPCVPSCRAGFMCKDGECVSLCNPPCPPGYRCDPQTVDCVPIAPSPAPQPTRAPQPPPAPRPVKVPSEPRLKTEGSCGGSDECAENYICFDNECEREWHVVSAGNVLFYPSTILNGLGTFYSAMAPIFWSLLAYDDYYYDGDNYYDSWEYECRGYRCDEDEIAIALAPQSSAFVIFGALNRIPLHKQARHLRTMGLEAKSGLIATSWILYGTSIATTTLNIFSYFSNSQGFATSTAFINAAVLSSSFIVNTVAYARQRRALREAVAKEANSRERARGPHIELLPYVSVLTDGGGAGLALRF